MIAAARPFSPLRADARVASTLVETMVGVAVATFGLTGLYVANSQCLGTARAHREILTAEHCLEQRAEQGRAAPWTQLTTALGLQTLLQSAFVNDDSLSNHTETITVSAYPTVSPSVPLPLPLAVTRDASGNTAVTSQPPYNLQNSAAVRIDLQEGWTSAQGGRTRSRETSTVVAFGGLLTR